MKTRIGIYGYGNLGRGVELALMKAPDMEPAAVFTRRDPASVKTVGAGVPVLPAQDVLNCADRIDVMILCGGSAFDLPEQTPQLASSFHVVDSFDNHSKIPEHFARVDAAAKQAGKVAAISLGWDPGLFSLNRLLAASILPEGQDYTFWGRGVSQGHSDAVRRVEGVLDARQYTIPREEALQAVRAGETPELSARQKHTREVFAVAAPGADRARIEREIVTMPAYFDAYDTTVHFISREELERDHAGLPHGGFVIRSGRTGEKGEHRQVVEYRLQLDSNPEFTASILVAYARAVYRLAQEGKSGCFTVFDIPPVLISPLSPEELRAKML